MSTLICAVVAIACGKVSEVIFFFFRYRRTLYALTVILNRLESHNTISVYWLKTMG